MNPYKETNWKDQENDLVLLVYWREKEEEYFQIKVYDTNEKQPATN